MNRRELLERSAALGGISAWISSTGVALGSATSAPLTPPAAGTIPVAFVLSKGAVVIDFAGPWEVFQDVNVAGRKEAPFDLYTVAETLEPVRASSGLMIVPNYSIDTSPAPKIIVIPAQRDAGKPLLDWIRNASKTTDITMSVCTGAFVLAATGLLAGRSATTHHDSYRVLAMDNPDISVKRGARFVEDGKIASSGGLSSGIDLALRVVERYFGREVATQTAFRMEYQGQGWLDADSNRIYAQQNVSPGQTVCTVCAMVVDPKSAPFTVYRGEQYYFCLPSHKARFDADPKKWLAA
ncbi:MAG TPA: DJ-1/PfpI family protein [Steroidobacteraceae bacterium]|jgi:putative intracellular protease/amidase/YHS domain-containing protein|nr:DJ-1/PfpI family protein [Steroidobacteraceae bacterium]